MGKVLILLGVVALLVGLYLAGPRIEADTELPSRSLDASSLEGLVDYLATGEARFPNLTPGAEKTIIWANGDAPARTERAIVYLHGFSATRQETAPLSDRVADALDANLFYTRLAGHGLSGEELAAATVTEWLADAHEAVEIGKMLGDEVIVIGVSTGATLAIWLAAQERLGDDVTALIFLSPNLGPRQAGSDLLLGPWGRQLTKLVFGPERAWEPHNEGQATFWTYRYPVEAVNQTMAAVGLVRQINPGEIEIPTLIFYNLDDTVVDPRPIERYFTQLGSEQKVLAPIANSGDPDGHILAGDILSPGTTDLVVDRILSFIEGVR